jgi:uncharacterized protein
MKTERALLDTIEDFLAQRRIAMVGISREGQHFSVMLFKELRRRGYDVVPVNPKMTELWGPRCFARVQEIQPPVDGALLMTSPSVTETVVRDCAEAGIRRVWMYRAVGQGAVSDKAVDFCRERGIAVVPGECPFMFLPKSGFHRIHGFIRKITRRFPRRGANVTA